jgi:hypothetical protein
MAGIYSFALELALGAVIWFLTAAWLDFTWNRKLDLTILAITGLFFFFFTLLLLASRSIAKDPRWHETETSLVDVLHSVAGHGGLHPRP